MMPQTLLLGTTMLTGVVGALFVSTLPARAADVAVKAPDTPLAGPAVDGFNGKVDGFGGSLGRRELYGSQGALSIPLGAQFGAQIDGAVGRWGGRSFENVAPHLFWRDPARGLVGIYTSHTWWDQFGGVYIGHVAGEGEYYWGRWTLQGIAGVEFGNSTTNVVTTTAGTLTETYDIKTRYFDHINLKYYVTNDWDVFVGHRYLGGQNALALGTEVALPIGRRSGLIATGFVEGRIGEHDFQGIWGGLKLYFGQRDKPLIDRHRQDDPTAWGVNSLFGILGNSGQTFQATPPPPPPPPSPDSAQ